MNKKGFTIIELLTVISIMLVVASIFTVSMIRITNRNKEDEYDNMLKEILSSADAYVSLDPTSVENLYEGYGFVDIKVGTLRDRGLLDENIKNPETGEIVPDSDIVRVELDENDKFIFTYPVKDSEKDKDALLMIAEDLEVDTVDMSTDDWCRDNEFTGIYNNTEWTSYLKEESKLYLLHRSTDSEENGHVYDEGYDKIELTSACNVDPTKAGNYTINYTYRDPYLNKNKTVERKVTVVAKKDDVVAFDFTINEGQDIIRGTSNVPIKIVETYRDGNKATISVTKEELESESYTGFYYITGFATNTVGENLRAQLMRTKANSDGTIPASREKTYNVLSDTYTATFNYNYGSNKTVEVVETYGEKYILPSTPSRTNYSFVGWYTTSSSPYSDKITSSSIYSLLKDQTLYARWTYNPPVTVDPSPSTGGSTDTREYYEATFSCRNTTCTGYCDVAGFGGDNCQTKYACYCCASGDTPGEFNKCYRN